MALLARTRAGVNRLLQAARGYFEDQDPRFVVAFAPALLVSILLFVRSPLSNYIFDEQEALLANPYVNGNGLPFWSAFTRDFWGLPPERSIGSYRPIPNLVWRLLWHVSHQPFIHHWVNVIGHAVNGALVSGFVLAVSGQRKLAWLAGGAFLSSAVLTEAVSGVVGIADVLGGMGVLLALHALRLRLWLMPIAVLLAESFGLFSKESAIVALPLVAFAALATAAPLHPERPLRVARSLVAFVALLLALVAYTEFRKRAFPVVLADELLRPLAPSEAWPRRLLHEFLRWFQQPSLPRDPINNPLVDAPPLLRIAAALRIYAGGLGQVLLPWTLSGDYSYRAEPVPVRPIFWGSVAGALLLVVPPVLAFGAFVKSVSVFRRLRGQLASERRAGAGPWALAAVGLFWFPVAYFPHSNIPVLLPTVRAERFWYLPVVGTSLLLGLVGAWLLSHRRKRWGAALLGAFLGVQAVQARAHALDYMDDLSFWDATRRAAPASAKAQLNYSVMLGARGKLVERLHYNGIAKELAPNWAMAHVYYGDTLCRLAAVAEPAGSKPDPAKRLARAERAFPHYLKGFELAPNDPNLVSLGLQCLWDEKLMLPHRDELSRAADRHPGSWLSFLVNDTLENGQQNAGVQKKYRPRSYDEGPKTD